MEEDEIIFTPKSTFDDFEKIIDWDAPFEYYYKEEKFYSKVLQLDSKLNVTEPNLKIRVLEEELNSVEESIKSAEEPKLFNEQTPTGKVNYMGRAINAIFNLTKITCQLYQKNNAITLEDIREQLKIVVSSGLDQFRSDPDHCSDYSYRPGGQTIRFGINIFEAKYYIISSLLEMVATDIISKVRYKNYLEQRITVEKSLINRHEDKFSEQFQKLKWKGTPAQLAFVINLLQEKGYIEGLTPYGERNAKIVLTHFEIKGHNSTPESLGKCFQQLKKDELPINSEDAAKFQRIPHRNDLKK